jgi:hypothetical protein
MPEVGHGDWVVAIASVVAAGVGGVVIFLFDRCRATRRSLLFVVQAPQAVAQGLRAHGTFLEIKVGDRVLQELNVASVSIKNSGNVQLNDISFDVIVPGSHSFVFSDCLSFQRKLKNSVTINTDERIHANQRFTIAVPFLNPSETFEIKTFSDNLPVSCRVECRLAGVTTQIDTPESIAARYRRRQNVLNPLMMFIAVALAALVSFFLADFGHQVRLELLELRLDRKLQEFNEPLPPENSAY